MRKKYFMGGIGAGRIIFFYEITYTLPNHTQWSFPKIEFHFVQSVNELFGDIFLL